MIAKDRGRGMWLFGFVLAVVVIGNDLAGHGRSRDTTQKYPGASAGTAPRPTRQYQQRQPRSTSRTSMCRASSRRSDPGQSRRPDRDRQQPDHFSPAACRRVPRPRGEESPRAPHQPHADRPGPARQEAGGHGGGDRSGDRTVARRFGITREGWLRTLDKERGHQPGPVRPRHHLSGPRAAETVRRGECRSLPTI